jgi:hypothetical protein
LSNDRLDGILASLSDNTACDGGRLERIDSFVQIEFADREECRTSFGARPEYVCSGKRPLRGAALVELANQTRL